MGACNIHKVPEVGCVDCLQDERDNLRAEVNQLRATLETARLEPVEGDRCRLCGWQSTDGIAFTLRSECWPCRRIKDLNLQVEELRKKAVLLDAFALRVIADRGCVCNEADHRCATNQLYEDLEKIHHPNRYPQCGICLYHHEPSPDGTCDYDGL